MDVCKLLLRFCKPRFAASANDNFIAKFQQALGQFKTDASGTPVIKTVLPVNFIVGTPLTSWL